MIKLVIGMNIAIALCGFYLAWRIWQVKRELTSITVALTAWESHIHRALNPDATPKLILRGQQAMVSARERYARLLAQVHQLQRIFLITLRVLRVLRVRTRLR